jgi:2-keto-3-deoxy-L-rhamnonate aldolase RhmA
MSLQLMYITNSTDVAALAESAGVDRIFIDLEINGKEERQGHLDAVISRHSITDVKKIKSAITKAELLVRVNPIYDGSKDEIDRVIFDGAEVVMLPMFTTVNEVEQFVDFVNGKAKVCLLLETPQAMTRIDDILCVPGIDEIHIGLNDLHLGMHLDFMFELLSGGIVEYLCKKIAAKGIKYGFGGIARIGLGMLPAEHIITEHHRLGSQMAILSRSFCNANKKSVNEVEEIFIDGIKEIRNFEKSLLTWKNSDFDDNRMILKEKVNKIVAAKNYMLV